MRMCAKTDHSAVLSPRGDNQGSHEVLRTHARRVGPPVADSLGKTQNLYDVHALGWDSLALLSPHGR
jgi:hypothetical protein